METGKAVRDLQAEVIFWLYFFLNVIFQKKKVSSSMLSRNCKRNTMSNHLVLGFLSTHQALSGVGESIQVKADILGNTALSTALNTQFLFQIGVFTAIPMILGFILEEGFIWVSCLLNEDAVFIS